MLLRRNLPELFQTETEFLRLTLVRETELCNQLLTEVAAGAFRKQRVFRAQFHAAREAVFGCAILAEAHVARRHAGDRTDGVVKHFGRRKAWVDFHTETFSLRRQPAADVAERDNESAVIAHQWRHHQIGKPHRAAAPKI